MRYEHKGNHILLRLERGEEPVFLPGEEEERRMYVDTLEILSQAGYRRYEISNYARQKKDAHQFQQRSKERIHAIVIDGNFFFADDPLCLELGCCHVRHEFHESSHTFSFFLSIWG